MNALEFILDIPFITVFLVGFGIFELVQLLLGKREPTKSNIVIDSLMISGAILVLSTNLIARLMEKEALIMADIANSTVTFMFFSVFLTFECVFYKHVKVNKTTKENTTE